MRAKGMTLEKFGDLTSHSIEFIAIKTNRYSWFSVTSYKIIEKNLYKRIDALPTPVKYKDLKKTNASKSYSKAKYTDVND